VWASVPVLTMRLPHRRSCTSWPWPAPQTSSSPSTTSRPGRPHAVPHRSQAVRVVSHAWTCTARVASPPAQVPRAHHGPHRRHAATVTGCSLVENVVNAPEVFAITAGANVWVQVCGCACECECVSVGASMLVWCDASGECGCECERAGVNASM
jgi:hypothetical protein